MSTGIHVEIEGKDFLRHVGGEVAGNGTRDSPYRIGKEDSFPNKVKLIHSEHYIEFSGNEFAGFGVIDSKNITFIDCSFASLTLQRSEDLVMNKCQIASLYLTNGKNSHFRECSINWIHNFFSSGNVFEQCKIGNPQELKEGIFESSGFDKIILYILLFLVVTFLPNIFLSIMIWENYWVLIGNAVVIGGLGFIYWSIKRNAKKDAKQPNILR